MSSDQNDSGIGPATPGAPAAYESMARGMLQLLLGSLFVVLDMGNRQYQRVEQTASDGTITARDTGWQFDLIPDEIGHLLMAIAFFGFATTARGSLGTWLKALGWWQLLMIPMTLIGHRIDDVVVTEITDYGSRTTTTPRWILGYLVPLLQALEALGEVAAGWCLVKLCRSHDLVRGAQLWKRYAWLMSIVAAFYVASGAFFITYWFSHPEEPITEAVPYLSQHFVAFAVLAAAIVVALGVLWLHACLATRAEARGAA